MDYFTDLLAMFLDLDRVWTLAVYGRVRELSDSIKKICSEDERRSHGLKRHEGEQLITYLKF